MIITVDTSKDSKEEIKKLINFLQTYISSSSYATKNAEDVPMPSVSAFNMFGDNSSLAIDTQSSSEEKEEQIEETEKSDIQILPY